MHDVHYALHWTHGKRMLDYEKNYRYAHNETDAYAAGENYFPVDRGLEIKIKEKLERLRKLDSQS